VGRDNAIATVKEEELGGLGNEPYDMNEADDLYDEP
jgi:hypothetical protein